MLEVEGAREEEEGPWGEVRNPRSSERVIKGFTWPREDSLKHILTVMRSPDNGIRSPPHKRRNRPSVPIQIESELCASCQSSSSYPFHPFAFAFLV